MNQSTFHRATLMAALLAFVATLIQPAEAGPMRLRVENVVAGVGVVITDNVAGGGDLDPLLGSIIFSGAVGASFPITVTVGTSNSPGGPTFSELDLTNVSISAGGGTLRITLEDDDYTYIAHKLQALVGGVLSAPAGSSITLNSWVNPGNLVPDLGPDVSATAALVAIGAIPVGSIAAFGPGGITFGPGPFSASSTVSFPEDSLYSLFAQATIAFTGAGTVSFNDNQRALPLPATLLLTLLGLPLIALARRRSLPRY